MDDETRNGLDEFFSHYPAKHYNKGQLLIYAHEDPAGIFYLDSGKVRKYDVGPSGDEVVLNVFGPGIFFPIAWAVNRTPNRYFFEAATPIEVRRAPVDAFNTYLDSHPKTIHALLKHVYDGLENAQRRTVLLMSGDAHDRLLFELFIEGRRSGQMQRDGSCVITIGLTELAQRAGLTRETISRELGKLIQSNDMISRQGRSLVIRDFRALEAQLSE